MHKLDASWETGEPAVLPVPLRALRVAAGSGDPFRYVHESLLRAAPGFFWIFPRENGTSSETNAPLHDVDEPGHGSHFGAS